MSHLYGGQSHLGRINACKVSSGAITPNKIASLNFFPVHMARHPLQIAQPTVSCKSMNRQIGFKVETQADKKYIT